MAGANEIFTEIESEDKIKCCHAVATVAHPSRRRRVWSHIFGGELLVSHYHYISLLRFIYCNEYNSLIVSINIKVLTYLINVL